MKSSAFTIEAEVYITMMTRAPEVVLSFNGLAVPTELLTDLAQLGWTIPPIPPPPGTAIEWTPDPMTGQEYTLRPWRITDFALEPNAKWTDKEERHISASTMRLLERHNVSFVDTAEAQAA